MKSDLYQKAVDHLEFSNSVDLAAFQNVRRPRPVVRILRSGLVAALIGILLMTGVAAVGGWIYITVVSENIGQAQIDIGEATHLEFISTDNNDGISVHYTQLGPYSYFYGEGYLYHNGVFYKLDENFNVVAVESKSLTVSLEKDNRTYEKTIEYVQVDDGIVTATWGMEFYPIVAGEIHINLSVNTDTPWPAYVDLETGEVRDALPNLTDASFEGTIYRFERFRDGYLVYTGLLVKGGGSYEDRRLYWVNTDEYVEINLDTLPSKYWDAIIRDQLYCWDEQGNLYQMNDDYSFRKVEEYQKGDEIFGGLWTTVSEAGTLQIVDLANQKVYEITDLEVDYDQVGFFDGYFAVRSEFDDVIAVVHRADRDYTAFDSIALLDTSGGTLRQLSIDPSYYVSGMGWLDNNKFVVIYNQHGVRYMTVYEFTA